VSREIEFRGSLASESRASGGEGNEVDLRDLLGLLLDEWKTIAGVTLLVVLLAGVYAFTATPIYETNALVQVEQQKSALGGLEELSSMLSGEAPTEAEIEIVRSRMVLGDAIAQENLDIEVEPKRFPLIGGVLARQHEGPAPAEPWLGFDSFAWGGERLRVDRLDVDRGLENEPLKLIAGEVGRYAVYAPDRTLLVEGTVGHAADGDGISMFVSELVARTGTEFRITKKDLFTTLEDLHERLRVAERGRQTGILALSLEGEDNIKIASTLNAIASIYLKQNVERLSEEAAQTLAFLEEQLPQLRAQLYEAEHALNQFRVTKGSVDLNLEAQGLLEQLTEVEKQISELELQRVEGAQRFTAEHPTMVALAHQKAELGEVRDQLERRIRALPQSEQDTLRLMRDVTVANELYLLLLNRAQEMKVLRAGTIGNVRIIDAAFVPREPVKPRKALVLALGLFSGGMFGVLVVLLRHMLDSAIRDPKILEQHFAMPVYAIVPRSELMVADARKSGGGSALLVERDPNDPAIESLRSLRTSLEFLFHEAPSRILTIGGPAPEIGKSFVSANLGALMAQAGRRVLVIDGDLRRGHLNKAFSLDRSPGLSDLIAGEVQLEQAVRPTSIDGLFILPTGTIPPNPAELLVSRRFEDLLGRLAAAYDVVVIDAPPVLAASEAAHLAKLSGVSLVVVRSGRQNRREVELAVDRLSQAGATPRGFIFNDLVAGSRRYAYAGYRYYRYEKQAT